LAKQNFTHFSIIPTPKLCLWGQSNTTDKPLRWTHRQCNKGGSAWSPLSVLPI
jgi:hypothetical protein